MKYDEIDALLGQEGKDREIEEKVLVAAPKTIQEKDTLVKNYECFVCFCA